MDKHEKSILENKKGVSSNLGSSGLDPFMLPHATSTSTAAR
jgi:hypothetical protein